MPGILFFACALCSGARRVEVDPIYDSLGIERESPFGYKYIFELEDAIDAMPESLVDFPAFERCGLE